MPVLAGRPPAEDSPSLPINTREFAAFLQRQHLQTAWLGLIERGGASAEYESLAEHLKSAAKAWAILELPQRRLLTETHRILNISEVDYFFAKGAHLRHVIYDNPQERSAIDIDLFVKEADTDRAIAAFEAAGYESRPLAETISHELKLTRHNGDIDLHWHLLRPGRIRPGLMSWLFSRRERFGDFWGLDDTASLLVMLVHPAITKYLLSPTSMLIHQVDQARLIERGRVDWKALEDVLGRSGARTAAWSSLYVLRKLGGICAPHDLEEKLSPGRIHRWYLRQWIDRAWITQFFEKRWLVAGFFSLALQDSLTDAIQAMRALRGNRESIPAWGDHKANGA
ncbi:MAG: nucleotidyltransferase family protein [Gammaproteobacteria bacterium]|nr:nucleotidyltransferase family protein [Gammaproteobacteria bacterium]